MGSSVAYHLKLLSPATRVCVVERDPNYAHASAPRSAGGIRQQFSLPENIELSLYGLDFLRSAGTILRVPGDDEPDVQLTLHPWDKYGRTWPNRWAGIASIEIANNHPRSRGRVALRSARFGDPPIFEGPYLRDANDSRALVWALRRMRERGIVSITRPCTIGEKS